MKVIIVEEGQVKIDENCLMIPELKRLVTKYKDEALSALAYVYYMTSPESPYSNIPEEERSKIVSDDVGGDFGLDDKEIEVAISKLATLYTTPSERYYKAMVKSMDRMSEYLNKTPITDGRDGNIDAVRQLHAGAAKTLEAFKKLEKMHEEEVRALLRGKATAGMY